MRGLLAKVDAKAVRRLTATEQRTVRDRLLATRAAIDAALQQFSAAPTRTTSAPAADDGIAV